MSQTYPNAALPRRLAAIIYDTFLVIAVWMLSTNVLVVWVGDGEAVSGWPFQLFLFFEWFVFYYFFWRVRGQTLGMQVWKIRAVNEAGETLSTVQCIVRWLLATLTIVPAGIGFLWMAVDPDRLTLYDRWSKTRIVYLGKNPYRSETR